MCARACHSYRCRALTYYTRIQAWLRPCLFASPRILTKDNKCTCLQGVRGLRRGTLTAWHIKWPLYRGCPMAIVSSYQEPAALPKSFWNFPGGSSRYLLANGVSVHRDIPWL